MGKVTLAGKAGQNAVNAFNQATAIQICVEVSSGAFACMVFGSVAATTDRADDNILRKVTVFG